MMPNVDAPNPAPRSITVRLLDCTPALFTSSRITSLWGSPNHASWTKPGAEGASGSSFSSSGQPLMSRSSGRDGNGGGLEGNAVGSSPPRERFARP